MLRETVAGIGILAGASGVNYGIAASVSDNTVIPPALVTTMTLEKNEAELRAIAFAERLEYLHERASLGTLDTTTVIAMRDELSHRFNEAYREINKLEENGDLADAALARSIIQNAIDYHMQDAFVGTMSIAQDLNEYSTLMTESLIERSAKQAA